MTDVFISYAREEKGFVHSLFVALKGKNRDAWVDWEDILPTSEWMIDIFKGIESAENFVFIISSASLASNICSKELNHAIECNKRLIPIVRQDVREQEVPGKLRELNWLFFRDIDNFDSSFESLLVALDTDLDWVKEHTRLLVRAIEWGENSRDASFLLSGRDLAMTQEWLERSSGKEPFPTTFQHEYVRASAEYQKGSRRRLFRFVSLASGLLLVGLLVAIYAWLATSYYLSLSDTSAVVVRAGHPGLKGLPGFDQAKIVTDHSLRDLADPSAVSDEDLTGFWLQQFHGYTRWGEQLFSRLQDVEAGLAYWRLSAAEQALQRLAQGVEAGDVTAVKTLVYVALQSEDQVGPAIDMLIKALQVNDDLHEVALEALAVVRDTQPHGTAVQLESLAGRLPMTSGFEAVAIAEAIGVLGGGDLEISRQVVIELLAVLHASEKPDFSLAAARGLQYILVQHPVLVPLVIPDLTELAFDTDPETRQILVAVLGLPSDLNNSAKAMALQATSDALRDEDPMVRRAATDTLGLLLSREKVSNTSNLPMLLEMVEDNEGIVRVAAVEALSLLLPQTDEQEDIVAALISLVRTDGSVDVRLAGIETLASVQDDESGPSIVAVLVEATGNSDALVRWGAVDALAILAVGQVANVSQVEASLQDSLSDRDPAVRQATAQGLLLLADQVESALAPALDEFYGALTSDDWRRSEQAERLAPRLGETSPGAAGAVANGLQPYALQDDWYAASQVIKFLRAIGENQPQALPAVVLALADLLAHDETKDEAAMAFWSLRSQPAANLTPAVELLLDRLNSTRPLERKTAAQATARLAAEYQELATKVVAGLQGALLDPDASVRAEAAHSLGLIGQHQPIAIQTALHSLTTCLRNDQPTVRAACADAYSSIAESDMPPSGAMVDPLVAALRDPSPKVRQSVGKALGHLAAHESEPLQRAIEPVRAALRTEVDSGVALTLAATLGILDGHDPEIANEMVGIATSYLASNDLGLSQQAIGSLRNLGQYQPSAALQAIETLQSLLVNGDADLRQRAMLAIRDIGMSDSMSAQVALSALGVALADSDSQVRVFALQNGIAPIVRNQPSTAVSAVDLLEQMPSQDHDTFEDAYIVGRAVHDAQVAVYAALAADQVDVLWPLIASSSASSRAVGREVLMLVAADNPDKIPELLAALEMFHSNRQPHVRQSAAMAGEMIALVQRTDEYLNTLSKAERWSDILEWLPEAGVDVAVDFVQTRIREQYPLE